MDIVRLSIFLIVYTIKFNRITGQECVWNLNTDLPIKYPIYINPFNNSFLIPKACGLTLELNQNVVLACPGGSNIINGTGLKEITAKCTSNNQLLYSDNLYTLKSLECTSSTSSNLEFSKQSCGAGLGEILKIGFKTSVGAVYLIDVCYDKSNEASIYTINTIYGTALSSAEIESNRPSFRIAGLTHGTTSANLYKQSEQLKIFTTLLGQKQATKYINDSSYLARGHLAPDADFLFGSWSFATYFLVNAAPEWQVVNAGNWLKVESMARDIAIQRQEDIKVYTGTHQVLQLPNESGNLVDMYLMAPNKLRVPKWFWKIIYSPSTQQGIALITLNNPHVTSINPNEIFCNNICQETGWFRQEFMNFGKGFTFCCEVNNLINAVGTLTQMNVVANMTGPST